MTTKNPTTQSSMTNLTSKRITALQALPAGTQVTVGGTTYTVAQAIAIYQASQNGLTALNAKRTEVSQALTTSRTADAACRTFDEGVRAWATTAFPAGSTERVAFGATRKAKATATSAEKALTAEKAQATRKARGTLGPKEKLKIKGTVPGASAEAAAPAVASGSTTTSHA